MRNKYIAAVISLLLGWVGFHRFYLGYYGVGFLYMIFFWTGVPFGISIVESIYFLILKKEEFDVKYNYDYIIKNNNLDNLNK